MSTAFERRDVAKALADADSLCRERGKRLTASRRAVLEVLWQTNRTMGAYDHLHQLAQTLNKRILPPTVYRALHFLVEQAVRSAEGYFTNFTGTAGIWRRAAIDDAGGWSADTLTEDLDLSYRAQLRGWHAAYVEDLVVPEELPVSIDAYRRQQSRWATGSFQSAFKLLVPVLRSRNRAAVKLQAAVHLLAYGIGPLMLLQLMCYPILLLTLGRHGLSWPLTELSVLVVPIAVSPWFGFMVAQTRLGRRWWSGLPSLLCQVVGAGMSLTAMLALFRATRRGGKFIRTPKHRIEQPGQEWRHQAYVRVGDPRALGEALFGIGALAIVPIAGDHYSLKDPANIPSLCVSFIAAMRSI